VIHDLRSECPESEPAKKYELNSDPVNLDELESFQKILLWTDGTLTEILEIYMAESISIVKLFQDLKPSAIDIPIMDLNSGREIMERKVVLQGKATGKNFLYAESIIAVHRLEKKFRDGLIKSKIPIGKLWQGCRIETFKEMVATFREPAGFIADYFDIKRDESLLCRKYLVYSNRKPIMMITEKFPESYYV
jgi:chorismate-pyruvate lyase